MKTQLHFKLLLAVLLILHRPAIVEAQNFNGSRTFNKKTLVAGNADILINNQSGDLKIYISSDNSVTMNSTVEISGNSKADVDKIIAAIDKFKFSLSGNTLEIDTRFYKSMNTINNKSTMTLVNGDKVNIKDFKIRHELHIPKTANINLNNKYSDIETESLGGNAAFVLYNSKLIAENFSGELKIDAKYSKIKIGNISQNTDFKLYDTKVEIESCGNTNINSKYSNCEIKKAGALIIDSYDDKFNIGNLNSLKFVSKYSDFVSQASASEVKLDLYDCNLKINSAGRAFFNGKYSDVTLGNTGYLKIDDSYDNDIHLGNSNKIEVGLSKYSLFEIKSVTNFSINDAYDDQINIDKLNTDFERLSMNGKYGKLKVNAGSVPFKVMFKIKYPKVDIPESVKISKQIKDNSDLELVGGETGGTIEVKGYDMKVVIED
jgi:hypothetical protein